MDAFSLLIGGVLGGLAGWAFSIATTKQREATRQRSEVSKAKEKLTRIEGEAKNKRERSLAEALQGVLFYILGFITIVIMGMILISTLS